MEITVKKQTIALTRDDTLIRKSNKTYTVKFIFDEFWDGFTKTVQFRAGSTLSAVSLTNDKCDIPSACLENSGVMLEVLVQGVKDGEEQSTPWCLTSRILHEANIDIPMSQPHCQCSGGSPTPSPTPTGEVERLCNDFAEVLEDYPEDQLKDKSLTDVINEVCDDIGITATDEEVEEVLDEVWGSDEEP